MASARMTLEQLEGLVEQLRKAKNEDGYSEQVFIEVTGGDGVRDQVKLTLLSESPHRMNAQASVFCKSWLEECERDKMKDWMKRLPLKQEAEAELEEIRKGLQGAMQKEGFLECVEVGISRDHAKNEVFLALDFFPHRTAPARRDAIVRFAETELEKVLREQN